MIDRRTALAGIVTMFGATLFAPIARAASAQATPINDGPPSVGVFTAEQRALVTALSDRVIPTTDTPGAVAAGVPYFMEKLLADWALPEDKAPILAGLEAIEARSQKDYGAAAAAATPEQQDTLLTLAMNDQLPGGADFFDKFRQLVITGYYTSEIGITQEREYLPVPGQYDGAFLYSNVNKVYSS
ncbi:gluconate 2-dehydrogenase subunit 3 family protein [Sphingomonas gilva]|uniref:Gluconate 2-dehydrogenase subunit 3 family protein n=1 Tax=Sphingomonas gilva TaxID=2305907 RepID=A0A396RPF6_9SPHN|nr:gluconate 2-dehydrogenase subunit 3 family protein [Sphingomonas gilva]RHW18249.1 gluconate 2-dehydrogenase subunit 3 family protein [Sphingomonas gilva]